MRTVLTLSLLASGFVATGCQKTDSYDEAMPETAGYTMELATRDTGTTSAQSLGTSQAALDGPQAVGETITRAHDAIDNVNAAVHAVLDPLSQLIGSHAYAVVGGARVYVFQRDALTLRFTIARGADLRFGWLLEAKVQATADAAYVRVMAGAFARGDEVRRGRGVLGFDLSAFAMVDPTFHGSGELLIAFAHTSGHKVLRFAAKDFSSDVTQHETLSALFSAWRGPTGAADVRVAAYANLPGTATDKKELSLLHARWEAGVGGRVDAIAVDGDIVANQAIVAFACYRGTLANDEGYLLVASCDVTKQSCSPIETAGAIANCLPDEQTDQTPTADANLAPLPTAAPEDPGVPTSMPSL